MPEFEREPRPRLNFEKCITKYSEGLAKDASELIGRDDVQVLTRRSDTGSGRVKLAIIDERKDTRRSLETEFSLMRDDIEEFFDESKDKRYIWEMLSVYAEKDAVVLGLQEVRKSARGTGLGSAAIESLYVAAKDAGFKFFVAAPIDTNVGRWHMRHGAYVDYELEPRLEKRFFADEDSGTVVRFTDNSDKERGVKSTYLEMSLEARQLEYQNRFDARRHFSSIATGLYLVAERMSTKTAQPGDLATAQDVVEDLRELFPSLQAVPDDDWAAIQVIKNNLPVLEGLYRSTVFTPQDMKLLEDCVEALG